MTTATPTRDDKETLNLLERFGELLIFPAMGIVFAFWAVHQTRNTGLLTDEFGTLGMIYLYGGMISGLPAPIIRLITGRRQPARLFEAASNVFLFAGAIYYLTEWPFDFTYFADIFPEGLQFLFSWFNNTLARIPIYIMLVATPIAAISLSIQWIRHLGD